MKVSLNWLRRYVDISVSVEELCDKMTMSGFEVDGIEDLSKTMHNVVAARILKLDKHPDADRLQVCSMDVGAAEPIQIITGADNVFEGALVPAALHESLLPTGTVIKRGKLRGLPSEGMLCSGEELCLKESDYPGAEVYGILILKEDVAPGTDMREVLHLNDVIIDFSITSNRPDCQSMLGIAREVAVALGVPFKMPEPAYKTAGGDVNEHIAITVEDTELCPRYMGRIVKNLRIAPSPAWMQECLKGAGMRPINNIVDITNFVMLETGQPMHAFDLRDIRGAQIIVRRATDGEEIVTLDGKPHTLSSDMLVIADAEAPSCLAGIMGGQNSEIKPDTTDLLFECAKFRRDNVRRTGRTLGMRTESSARFEKGVDIHGVAYAMDRALQLIDELDAGDIIDGVIDCCDELPEPRRLSVAPADINALLGVDVPTEAMVDILCRLELNASVEDGKLVCYIPSRRDDIEGRADLAEEVVRVYGYDHIVGAPMNGAIVRGQKLPERRAADRLKATLTAQGLYEISTYSFISAKAADTLALAADDARRQAVALLNPLGEEYAVMRTQLVSSMLTVLATNYSRKNSAVRFFEVGKRFIPHALPLTEQPDEVPVLCLGAYGAEEDYFTLKGVVEALLAAFGAQASFARAAEPYLHPGRQATVSLDGKVVGVLGEVHPDIAEGYGIGVRAFVAELELQPIYAAAAGKVLRYQPLPRFPAVERDLALLCDEQLPAAEIEETIRAAGGKLLERVTLFDVYQGAQIAAGQKSVAYSLTFRSAEGTLSDADIDPAMNRIMRRLTEKGCTLRS